VHIATLLGIHVEQYLPAYVDAPMITFGLGAGWLLAQLNRGRMAARRSVAPPVIWTPSRRWQLILLLLVLAYGGYALWTMFATAGVAPGAATNTLLNWRRTSAWLMFLVLTGLVDLAESALGWQLLGARSSGALTAAQKRQGNWYPFCIAVAGFAASVVVYGMSFGEMLPDPLWLIGWFGIAAVLLGYLGYLLMPQAPELYPTRSALPEWVGFATQFAVMLLLLNIALSIFMALFSGGLLGALRITAAIFLLVYFAVARLIAAYRLGWPDLLPPADAPPR
jgi:hypothetical protein